MKTALYDRHLALGAKIVPFAGWEMPVYYKGVKIEHRAVREAVGLFDVSHMGLLSVTGADAERFLDYLSTNNIQNKEEGTVVYSVWCQEDGGCVDDVMIYRQDKEKFFVVANAGNRQKDLRHLLAHRQQFQVEIKDYFSSDGILALQGPEAGRLLALFFPEVKDMKAMRFIEIQDENQSLIISKTGYTGAGGFELYASNALIIKWWDQLLEAGKVFGIEPAGLGARDTLRLEMGFALYGHELDETIAANETVSAWTIKWEKENFLGKNALDKIEKSSHKRRQYGIKLIDPGIAREGCSVFQNNALIGRVTSGSFSPTLNQAIAIILTDTPLKAGGCDRDANAPKKMPGRSR